MVCNHYWPAGVCSNHGTCVTLMANATVSGNMEEWCQCDDGWRATTEFMAHMSYIPDGYDMDCPVYHHHLIIGHWIGATVTLIGALSAVIGMIRRCCYLWSREPPAGNTSCRRWCWLQMRAFPTRTMIIIVYATLMQLIWQANWLIDQPLSRSWQARVDLWWVLYCFGMNAYAMELSSSWSKALVRSLPMTGAQNATYAVTLATVERIILPVYITSWFATIPPLFPYFVSSDTITPDRLQAFAIASLLGLAYQVTPWIIICLFLANRLLTVLTTTETPISSTKSNSHGHDTNDTGAPPTNTITNPAPAAGGAARAISPSVSPGSVVGNLAVNDNSGAGVTSSTFVVAIVDTSLPSRDMPLPLPSSPMETPVRPVRTFPHSSIPLPSPDTRTLSTIQITTTTHHNATNTNGNPSSSSNASAATMEAAVKRVRLFRSILVNVVCPIPIPTIIFACWPYLRMRVSWFFVVMFPLLSPGMAIWCHLLHDRPGPMASRLHPIAMSPTGIPMTATTAAAPTLSLPGHGQVSSSLPLPLTIPGRSTPPAPTRARHSPRS